MNANYFNGNVNLMLQELDSGETLSNEMKTAITWEIMWFVQFNNLSAIIQLVERGADPNHSINWYDEEGTTPLLVAACLSHIAAATLLIDMGADPNQADETTGDTPLILAVKYNGDDLTMQTVRMLLDKGADPNKKNREGLTALMIATRNGFYDIANELMQRGGDPDQRLFIVENTFDKKAGG